MSELVSISEIRRDSDLQPRAMMNSVVIAEYAEEIENGVTFPPVTVYYDGETYWLADGFHRVAAAAQARQPAVLADVHQGSKRDAILFSVQANATHGLRRTAADKRKAVLSLLQDPEWAQWADRVIARKTATSHTFVAQVRASTGNVASERRFVTATGTESTMRTAGIGESNRERAQAAQQVKSRRAEVGSAETRPPHRVVEPNRWAPPLALEPESQEGNRALETAPSTPTSMGSSTIEPPQRLTPLPQTEDVPPRMEAGQPRDAVLTVRISHDYNEPATRRIRVSVGEVGRVPSMIYRGFLSEVHRLVDQALVHRLGGRVLDLYRTPAAEEARPSLELPFPLGSVVTWGPGEYGTVESFSNSLVSAYVRAMDGDRVQVPVYELSIIDQAELEVA